MELTGFTHTRMDLLRASDHVVAQMEHSLSGHRHYVIGKEILLTSICFATLVIGMAMQSRFLPNLSVLAKAAIATVSLLVGIFTAHGMAIVAFPKAMKDAQKTYQSCRQKIRLLENVKKMFDLYEALAETKGKIHISADHRNIIYFTSPSQATGLASVMEHQLTEKEARFLQTTSGRIDFTPYDQLLESILIDGSSITINHTTAKRN